MKIATWNVERLKHKKALDKMLLKCENIQADILVLTETDTRLRPNYRYCIQTPMLSEIKPDYYANTENRVSIFTNYPCVRQYETFDKYTSICTELETEHGNLLVYGTIIGILGNREYSFQVDLRKQIEDFARLSVSNNLCICGDFNCSFADSYYYTKSGRAALQKTFSENKIRLLTGDIKECIDHIAISEKVIGNAQIKVDEWNLKKALSDHKGIVVTIG